jgi:PHD/YefM family antitoxin component YafN of YafNO toxin-antitoxin module
MLKVKPEFLSKDGKRQFVILTIEDFDRMQEALEDARDLRELRQATRANTGKSYYTPAEVEQRVANRSARTKRNGRR